MRFRKDCICACHSDPRVVHMDTCCFAEPFVVNKAEMIWVFSDSLEHTMLFKGLPEWAEFITKAKHYKFEFSEYFKEAFFKPAVLALERVLSRSKSDTDLYPLQVQFRDGAITYTFHGFQKHMVES